MVIISAGRTGGSTQSSPPAVRGSPTALRHSFVIRHSACVTFLISSQIASSSARSTSPSRLPCVCNSSSSRLNRATNLSVAACSVLSASSLHLRARLTTANSKSPISSSIALRILRRDGSFSFAQFLFHLRDHVTHFGPIEIDARYFGLRFLRAHQRGQRRGQDHRDNVCLFLFFRALDRFPLFQHRAAIAHIAFAEHMRVTPDQFLRHVSQHIVDIEPAAFLARFRRASQ